MNLRKPFLVASAVLMASAFSSSAFAQDPAPFVVEGLAVAGSGCPAGSVDALASTGNGTQALTILFDSFNAEGSAPSRGRAVGEMKSCNIAITLRPNQGFQVALVNIETRGFVDVFGRQDTVRGVNNSVRITREYFFNGSRNNGYRFPILDTYVVNTSAADTIQEDTVGLLTYADCNDRVIARARMGINTTGEFNYGSIDSVDQNSRLTFNLRTRRCTGNEPKGPATIVDVTGGDDRATVKNACILRGSREVCYDENGDRL